MQAGVMMSSDINAATHTMRMRDCGEWQKERRGSEKSLFLDWKGDLSMDGWSWLFQKPQNLLRNPPPARSRGRHEKYHALTPFRMCKPRSQCHAVAAVHESMEKVSVDLRSKWWGIVAIDYSTRGSPICIMKRWEVIGRRKEQPCQPPVMIGKVTHRLGKRAEERRIVSQPPPEINLE